MSRSDTRKKLHSLASQLEASSQAALETLDRMAQRDREIEELLSQPMFGEKSEDARD